MLVWSICYRKGDLKLETETKTVMGYPVENMPFAAVEHYQDIERRVLWLDCPIGYEDSDDNGQAWGLAFNKTLYISKLIMDYNREDYGLETEERKPIWIMLNTPGGDIDSMWQLINMMNISKTHVNTVNFSNALSAGAHLLAAGYKRYAMPGSKVLIHSGSCMFGGDREKMESVKKYYDALDDKINEYLLSKTRIDKKTFKKKAPSDWYLTAEEALEQGVVDDIITDLDVFWGEVVYGNV